MIYRNIIVAFWGIFLIYWLTSAFTTKKSLPRTRTGWTSIRFFLLIFLFAISTTSWGQQLLNSNIFGYNRNVQLIGTICAGLGIGFAIWARAYIGRNWGMPMTLREQPELVSSGPYKSIRHPIYSGVILATFGTGLALGNFWLILFVFFAFYFTYSARAEERMLTQRIADYAEYKSRTKMLIPFII